MNSEYPKPEFKKYVLTESMDIIDAYFDDAKEHSKRIMPHNDSDYRCGAVIKKGNEWAYRDLKDGYDIYWDIYVGNCVVRCKSRVIADSDDKEFLEKLKAELEGKKQ